MEKIIVAEKTVESLSDQIQKIGQFAINPYVEAVPMPANIAMRHL